MSDGGGTIYKTCRKQAGYTREHAAELLFCSPRALARYESGEVQVPDAVAYRMVQLYGDKYLAMEHLRLVSQVAGELIPRVELCDIQTGAIRLFNTLGDFMSTRKDRQLLRIAEDGAISPEEEAQVDEILRDLEYLTKVFAEVRLAVERG